MNSKQSFEYLIRRIYSKYAPSKSAEVSNLLTKYNGQEDQLFEKICKKYDVSENEIRELQAELNKEEIKPNKGILITIIWFSISLLAVLLIVFIQKKSSNYDVNKIHQETVLSADFTNEKPSETSNQAQVMETQFDEESNEKQFAEPEKTYIVKSKTFFHDSSNQSSERNAYLVEGEIFSTKIEENGFLYVEFVNPKGQKTNGWIQIDNSIAQTISKQLTNKNE